jgi:hypothetical protein
MTFKKPAANPKRQTRPTVNEQKKERKMQTLCKIKIAESKHFCSTSILSNIT